MTVEYKQTDRHTECAVAYGAVTTFVASPLSKTY